MLIMLGNILQEMFETNLSQIVPQKSYAWDQGDGSKDLDCMKLTVQYLKPWITASSKPVSFKTDLAPAPTLNPHFHPHQYTPNF